jgi:hypothetical protein
MKPNATPEEAAAIVAAVERFIADTTPETRVETVSPWTRAALLEGVSAKQTIQDLEGGMQWLW